MGIKDQEGNKLKISIDLCLECTKADVSDNNQILKFIIIIKAQEVLIIIILMHQDQ